MDLIYERKRGRTEGHTYASVAKRIRQRTFNSLIAGSNPAGGT